MKYNLSDVCSRLSSGKNIRASEISSEGEYPVFGGNGQRGFTNHFNFDGECAIILRECSVLFGQGVYDGTRRCGLRK